ncbi:MAG: rod shape-determining protein MreD, partial [Thermoleophilia bacterium]|nr:rod shape-determining protein MreD [Thermoleophilia bacterium]
VTPEATGTLLRMSVVVIGSVILQLAVITQFRLFGVVPDVIPVLVVMIGLLTGSTGGAVAGFVAGFMIDLILLQTMGVSSLLLTIGGYAAGRLRELRDPVHPLTNPMVGALASAYFVLGFATMQFSLGLPAPLLWPLIWQTLWSAVFGALLAAPLFRLARWAVMPALGHDDPMLRHRRAVLAPTSVLEKPTIDPRSRGRRITRRRGRRSDR